MGLHSGGVAEYRASEGKAVEVPYRGPVGPTVLELLGGLRSACTYTGSSKLKELSRRTTFIRVTAQLNEVRRRCAVGRVRQRLRCAAHASGERLRRLAAIRVALRGRLHLTGRSARSPHPANPVCLQVFRSFEVKQDHGYARFVAGGATAGAAGAVKAAAAAHAPPRAPSSTPDAVLMFTREAVGLHGPQPVAGLGTAASESGPDGGVHAVE